MIDPNLGYQIATISLVLFALLGAFDGIYFHMIKFKLYQHPPAQFEHQLHTFRGLLFVPIALIFFIWNSAGLILWFGFLLLLVDFVAEIVDILVEKEARAELGGISPFESVIHVTATGFRMVAIALILALKPIQAFSITSYTCEFPPLPSYLHFVGMGLLVGLCLSLMGQGFHGILLKLKQFGAPTCSLFTRRS